MKPSTKEVWLWLLLVMNPHNPKTAELLEHFDSAEELACAIRDEKCQGLSDAEKQRARNIRSREVRQIIDECAANDIRIITLDDEEYPSLLKNIYSPPIVLFVKGTLTCLDEEVSLAVVGPRNPSAYAVKVAQSLCGSLAQMGTVLVSGLAVGIDAVAHSCAVNSGTPTIGVLACGHLVNYPAENEGLKQAILSGGGAVISELLPHAGVEGRYFHDRNRIISGLGLGTLIVEAYTRSGCLITANHAVEQGRDLFCVPPGDITQEYCAGVVPYLRDGAIPVFDYLDIVHEYMYHYFNRIDSDQLNERFPRTTQSRRPARRAEPRVVKSRERSAPAPEQATREQAPEPAPEAPAVPEEVFSGLPEEQGRLLRLIAEQPRTADELIELTGMQYAQAAEALTELEILGHAELLPDGKYSLKA